METKGEEKMKKNVFESVFKAGFQVRDIATPPKRRK